MKYLKLFEVIKISDYRKYHRMRGNDDFQEKMKEYFMKFPDHSRNYDRIYFDFEVDPDDWKIKIPKEISDFMGWYHYPILDYNKGICRDHDGREIRIGRLFQKLGEDRLLKVYNDSKQNMLRDIGDLQIVISRHKYDIVGQSTDRGWTTCIDLHDKRYQGKHVHNLDYQISRGTSLVAYVIRKADRNINNPISRTNINGYCSREAIPWGLRTFRSKPLWTLNTTNCVYGTNVPGFIEFLIKWCDDFNKTK